MYLKLKLMVREKMDLLPHDIRLLMGCGESFGTAKDIAYLGSLNIQGLISYWAKILECNTKVSDYSTSQLSSLLNRVEENSKSSFFEPILVDPSEICTEVNKCISGIKKIEAVRKEKISEKIDCLRCLLEDAERKPQLLLVKDFFPKRLLVDSNVICYTKGIDDLTIREKFINGEIIEINNFVGGAHVDFNRKVRKGQPYWGRGFDFNELSPYVFKKSEIEYFKRNPDYANFWARHGVLKEFKFDARYFIKDLRALRV